MSAEEELRAFEKKALRKARITSIILGSAAVITILSMVYGITQNIEAEKQRYEAENQKAISEECEKRLVEVNANLIKAMEEARLTREEAEKQFVLAQQSAAAAKAKSKK